jgi:hypothetical protein
MTAKKRAPIARARGTTKPKAPPSTAVDPAAELEVLRDRIDALSETLPLARRAGPRASARLGELGETLERTVEEVRQGTLDRAKLSTIASTIAAIARLLGELLAAATGKEDEGKG